MPIETVVDPTGAGDSFAGGFMGYIASLDTLTRDVFKRAMFYAGVMGSFAVEAFGTERLQKLTREEIEERYHAFRDLTHLDSCCTTRATMRPKTVRETYSPNPNKTS